jgi:hypothetical protein
MPLNINKGIRREYMNLEKIAYNKSCLNRFHSSRIIATDMAVEVSQFPEKKFGFPYLTCRFGGTVMLAEGGDLKD